MKKLTSHLQTLVKTSPLSILEVCILIALFAVFPLGQLGRLQFIPEVALYIHDFLMLLWIVITYKTSTVVIGNLIKAVKNTVFRQKYGLELLFLAWVVLGILATFALTKDIVSLLYAARVGFYGFFAYTVAKKFQLHQLYLKTLLLVSGIWYWWLAVMLYVLMPDLRFLWLYGWDEHYYRLAGTLFDPGFTGMLIILTLLVVWSLRKTLPRWLLLPLYFALIAGVLLTYSRASYLALGVVALGVGTQRYIKHIGKAVLVGVILLVVYILAPKPGGEGVNLLRTSTIAARFTSAEQTFRHLKNHEWLIGRGLFSKPAFTSYQPNTKVSSHARMPDNIFITLLSQTGIVGLGLGIALLVKWLKHFWQVKPEVALSLAAVLTHSQFNNTLLQPFVLLYLLLFVASYGLKVTLRSTSD